MKKTFLALILLALVSLLSLSLVQGNAISAQKALVSGAGTVLSKADDPKIIKGKLESVTIIKAKKGKEAEAIVDSDGLKLTFLIRHTTTIYDFKWKALTLEELNKDSDIKIRYFMNKNGINEALSIVVLK